MSQNVSTPCQPIANSSISQGMLDGDSSRNESLDCDKATDPNDKECDAIDLEDGEQEEGNEKKRAKTSSVWLEFKEIILPDGSRKGVCPLIYKVFDQKNYSFLYSISDKNVQEIKISPGIMLLIFQRTPGYVPLKILSIEDGTVLKSFNHLLHCNKKVDFIEQFNEKLLVKQENENLQILDVRNLEL
ncbi:hypothetical protein J5N97_013755 [Dioscorea zingiberensis]|uniref:Uncharacterized protein n=1 Tax=Dioscorea zingiberensis TaxID=325984 RepID=A0A9D5CRE3_9LILI|nr:hypothetical protein J5N97_013755 [Dioscorea zingiberensis]